MEGPLGNSMNFDVCDLQKVQEIIRGGTIRPYNLQGMCRGEVNNIGLMQRLAAIGNYHLCI